MQFQFGKKSWITTTGIFILVSVVVVGRHLLHAVSIMRQIGDLERTKEIYQRKIEADSILLEQLKYDDYLEEYAREHFYMQRRNEHIYIIKED